MKRLYTLALLTCLVAVVLGAALWKIPRLPYWHEAVQPIAFSHKNHLARGATCFTCHGWVRSESFTGHAIETFAGLPETDACMTCHALDMRILKRKGKNAKVKPELAKLAQYVESGKIPWQRVYRLPGYVFFPHRVHIVAVKVQCSTCHGNTAAQAKALSLPLVNQQMDRCLSCHQQRHASVDCDTCHH